MGGSLQGQVDFDKVKSGFRAGSPFAYMSVTDADGDHTFSLRYVDLATDVVHIEIEVKTNCIDPLETIDLSIPLPPLPNKIGSYALELLWNSNDPMGSFRITVGERK